MEKSAEISGTMSQPDLDTAFLNLAEWGTKSRLEILVGLRSFITDLVIFLSVFRQSVPTTIKIEEVEAPKTPEPGPTVRSASTIMDKYFRQYLAENE